MVRVRVASEITREVIAPIVRFVSVSSGHEFYWGEIVETHLNFSGYELFALVACPCQFTAASSERPRQRCEVTVLAVQGWNSSSDHQHPHKSQAECNQCLGVATSGLTRIAEW